MPPARPFIDSVGLFLVFVVEAELQHFAAVLTDDAALLQSFLVEVDDITAGALDLVDDAVIITEIEALVLVILVLVVEVEIVLILKIEVVILLLIQDLILNGIQIFLDLIQFVRDGGNSRSRQSHNGY